MRVGLLGGTFDPPHVGHLVVAECARVGLDLDQVRWVVAGDPWMKSTVVDAHQRAELVDLAIADSVGMVVDRCEIERPGPTYTVDTLEALAAEEPGTQMMFLMGADAAATISAWHRPERVQQLAQIVVVNRNGELAGNQGITGAISLSVPTVAVSSSQLRSRYRDGQATRHLVPARVDDEIRRRGLYGATPYRQ